METDGQVNIGAGSIEIPKELEAAIQAKVAQLVADILDAKFVKRKRGRSRSSSRSRSRFRSKSRGGRSRSRSHGGRSRSRSHGKNKHRHFGPKSRGRRDRSRSRGRRDSSRSRGRKQCIGWESFAPFPSPHHHFHHHHAWFGGEFGPGARKGRWGKHGRFPFESNFKCKCGPGAEEKNDGGKNKEGTPVAEGNLRSDLEYLDLDDGVAEFN